MFLFAGFADAAIIFKDVTTTDMNTVANWSTVSGASTPNPASIGISDTLRFNEYFAPSPTPVTASLSANLAAGAVRLDSGSAGGGAATGNVTIAAGNTLTLNGNLDYIASTTGIVLNSAVGGSLTVNSNLALGASQRWVTSRTLSVGGDVNLGTNSLTFHNAGTATTTVSGILSNGSVAQEFGAAGGTVILSGANTYAGTTTISVGTLQIGGGGITGSLNPASQITNNATLAFNRSNTITQGTDFDSAIGGTGSVVQAGTGTTVLTGANTYAGTTFINGAGGGILKVTGSGVLGGAAGSATDTGNIVFSTPNSNNTLEFETSAQLGVADQIRFRNTGGTAGLGGNLKYVGTTAQTVGKTLQCDTSIGIRLESDSVGGSIKYNGAFSLGGTTPRPLYLGGTGTGNNELAIAFANNGAFVGTVTKNGAGTWILSGANTYTGATNVDNGKLLVNGTHTGGGTYTVAGGATLGGSGSIDSSVVLSGTISPGNSPGTFSTGSETWNTGSTYLFEIDDATGTAGAPGAVPGWDLLDITGSLTLGAAPININLTSQLTGGGNIGGDIDNFNKFSDYAWLFVDTTSIIGTYAGPGQFTIIDNFTNDTTSPLGPLYDGNFQVLRGDNPMIGGSNTDLYIYYNAAVVPEPSTYALALLGLVGLGLFACRRRRKR